MDRPWRRIVAWLGLALVLPATGCRMTSRRVPPAPPYSKPAPATAAPAAPPAVGFSMAPESSRPTAYAGSVGALDPSGMPTTGIDPYTGGAGVAPGAGGSDKVLAPTDPSTGLASPGNVNPAPPPAAGYNMGRPGTGFSPL